MLLVKTKFLNAYKMVKCIYSSFTLNYSLLNKNVILKKFSSHCLVLIIVLKHEFLPNFLPNFKCGWQLKLSYNANYICKGWVKKREIALFNNRVYQYLQVSCCRWKNIKIKWTMKIIFFRNRFKQLNSNIFQSFLNLFTYSVLHVQCTSTSYMYQCKYLISVHSVSFPLHVAFKIIVRHSNTELYIPLQYNIIQ